MIYKGQNIEDNRLVYVYDPYKELGSNCFQFNKEDLLEMLHDFEEKEKELEERGLNPNSLYLDFFANESCDGDYYQCDAECKVTFNYQRPETEDEKDTRILNAMDRIDKEIKRKEEDEQRALSLKEQELNAAIDLLNKNGYVVKK